MGNRKNDKYIDAAGRKLVGANLLREMKDAQALADERDKFRALEQLAKELSPNNESPSRSTIQRITKGQVGTSIDNLFLLARAMSVPPYRLFLDDQQHTTVHDLNDLVSRAAQRNTNKKHVPKTGRDEGTDADVDRPTLRRRGRA